MKKHLLFILNQSGLGMLVIIIGLVGSLGVMVEVIMGAMADVGDLVEDGMEVIVGMVVVQDHLLALGEEQM
jgi:hypothetical protein